LYVNLVKFSFDPKLEIINTFNIVRIPITVSEKFPSCGMIVIEGIINNIVFKVPLEPDGKGSHWFEMGLVLFYSFNQEPLNLSKKN